MNLLNEQPFSGPLCSEYQEGGYLTGNVPPDPWENPYIYFSPGLNGEDYTIESYGADGQEGGEGKNADIESWRLDEDC